MLWHPCLLQICNFQRFRTPSRLLNPPRLSTISNSPAAARSSEPPLKIPNPRGAWGAGDRKSRGVGNVRQVAGSRPVRLLPPLTAALGCAVRGEGVPPGPAPGRVEPGSRGSRSAALSSSLRRELHQPFLSPGSRREAPNPTWRVKKAEPGVGGQSVFPQPHPSTRPAAAPRHPRSLRLHPPHPQSPSKSSSHPIVAGRPLRPRLTARSIQGRAAGLPRAPKSTALPGTAGDSRGMRGSNAAPGPPREPFTSPPSPAGVRGPRSSPLPPPTPLPQKPNKQTKKALQSVPAFPKLSAPGRSLCAVARSWGGKGRRASPRGCPARALRGPRGGHRPPKTERGRRPLPHAWPGSSDSPGPVSGLLWPRLMNIPRENRISQWVPGVCAPASPGVLRTPPEESN